MRSIVQIKFLDHGVVFTPYTDELYDPIVGYAWGILDSEDEDYYYVISHFLNNSDDAVYCKLLKSAVLEIKNLGVFDEDIG